MNIMNNSTWTGGSAAPAFELFVIVLKIEIVLQVRLKNHEKYISAYQIF